MSAVLALVPSHADPPAAEQRVLRPVVAFAREMIVAPTRVRRRCQQVRPPARVAMRCRPPAAPLEFEQLDFIVVTRPRTYGECGRLVEGPCPFVSCTHHLYLDVNPRSGKIKFNFPGLEPWQLKETCVLRVVDEHGELSAAKAGRLIGLSEPAILKIERLAKKRYGSPSRGGRMGV